MAILTGAQAAEILGPFIELNKKYAKPVKMEALTKMMLNKMRKIDGIGLGIVDYRGKEPQVILSNELNYVEAYQHPELIEVLDYE
ncbi:hypothetical protein D3P96_07785 [Weissella viridescens]|uniref:Uncharacterized protein n=1 Tax=Weissella viridescens TaxID=1629 RepID=A0A3P2RDK5_WEIVI|nr:hypothetical protein [Weissella viridescens]RRG17445.1 hypothetical protein D3P96_07785 [Weissella viridescens]